MKNFTTLSIDNTTTSTELSKLVAQAMKASMGYANPLAEIRVSGWTPELRQEFIANVRGLQAKAATHDVKWVFVRFVKPPKAATPEEKAPIGCTHCGNPNGDILCGACERGFEAYRGDFGPLTRWEKAGLTRELNARRRLYGWKPCDNQ